MSLIEKIGGVSLNLEYYKGSDLYSDGEEDRLLEIVKTKSPQEFDALIKEDYSWPVLYHLSSYRENILDWIDFGGCSVLEIGSGCGAVTGAAAKSADRVVCIELSKKRSMINAYRHMGFDNIEIYVGNFSDITKGINEKFDFVTLIGVLEYGGLYIPSKNPFVDFVSAASEHLKPDGRLVIAIENKLGMKYWAGCAEDHTGIFFEGIENYPHGGGIRTFSRKELKELLSAAGLENTEFYYPYPDYKFPTVIYSDRYLPKRGELNNNMRNFDNKRVFAFDEKKAFDTVTAAGLFSELSNSFLVLARKD